MDSLCLITNGVNWLILVIYDNNLSYIVYPTINLRILDLYGVWLQQMSCTQFGGLKLFHVHAMILLKWLSDDICIESLFFGTCDRNGKIENSCTSKTIISMRFANESKLQQNTCDWASLAMTISLTTIKPTNFTTSPYFTPALLFYDNKKTTLWLLWEYYVVFMDLESMEMFVIFPD